MKTKSTKTGSVLVFLSAMLLLLLALRPGGAKAATTSVADGDVAGLIAAIKNANTNSGPDTINLASGGVYTLTVVNNADNGLPVVTSQITINGSGAVIERSGATGTPDFRIFEVGSTGDLRLGGVTVRKGKVSVFFRGGGGIYNGGTLTLTNSTVSGNEADNEYGYGGGIDNGGTLTLTNSTVSGNTASDDDGGGIYNSLFGTLTLTNSTVSGNTASSDGGGIYNLFGTLTLKNTILAYNSPNNCFLTMASLGHNISSDASCAFTGTGDMNNIINPLLGPFASNGGPTQTHLLLSGSPAINAVPFANCTDASGATPLATDQRGITRPQGTACDIGAVEMDLNEPVPTPTPSPSDIDGDSIPNASDPDMDGDGTANALDSDADNDGVPNATDTDDDGDGTADATDTTPNGLGTPTDIDGDGIANALDDYANGNGVPTCQGREVTISGATGGPDTLSGTKGADVIHGLGGNDIIRGGGGKDIICGGDGDDTLYGQKGKDALYGQAGKDLLKGGKGKDVCDGGADTDTAKSCETRTAVP